LLASTKKKSWPPEIDATVSLACPNLITSSGWYGCVGCALVRHPDILHLALAQASNEVLSAVLPREVDRTLTIVRHDAQVRISSNQHVDNVSVALLSSEHQGGDPLALLRVDVDLCSQQCLCSIDGVAEHGLVQSGVARKTSRVHVRGSQGSLHALNIVRLGSFMELCVIVSTRWH